MWIEDTHGHKTSRVGKEQLVDRGIHLVIVMADFEITGSGKEDTADHNKSTVEKEQCMDKGILLVIVTDMKVQGADRGYFWS